MDPRSRIVIKKNSVTDFLNLLDNSGISYVSWKNNHEIDKSLSGDSDLDIYIPIEFKESFINIAIQNSWIIVVNPIAKFPYIEHFYLISDNGKVYHLHVYFKVITGESWIKEFELPIGSCLIDDRCKHDKYGIYVLSGKSQAYLFAIRHLLKCGSISSRILYNKEIKSYKSEWVLCNYDAGKFQKYGAISLEGFIDSSGLLDDFRMSSYFNSFMFRIKLTPYLRLNYGTLPVYRLISFFSRLFNKFFFKKKKMIEGKGMVIAISGVDGSGKSSMVDSIDTCLSKFLTIKRLSLGKPQGKLIEFVRKFFSSKKTETNSPSKENSFHDTGLFKGASLLILAVLRFFESWKSQYYINKGYVVLVDRWPTRECGKMDGPKVYAGSASNILVKLFSKFEKVIYSAIPKADVCIFLEVSVDTAIKRNSMRIKDGKETESEIRERHIQNKRVRPIAKKNIRFDNDGLFEEKKKELLLLVRNELANASIYQ
jgi:thymidylate kinase